MDQRVIIMHGFEYREIDLIMRAVKKVVEDPRDVIFAKSTENSLKMKLAALIEDLTEDHNYLKENPPPIPSSAPGSATSATGTSQEGEDSPTPEGQRDLPKS